MISKIYSNQHLQKQLEEHRKGQQTVDYLNVFSFVLLLLKTIAVIGLGLYILYLFSDIYKTHDKELRANITAIILNSSNNSNHTV
jgi:hypothetical protein